MRLAWGLLPELKTLAPRDVDSDELLIVHCTLAGYQPEPLQPRWQRVQDPVARDVWQVDEQQASKRKLRSLHLKDKVAFLRVSARREQPNDFCGRCGRTWGSANYCAECGKELGLPEFRVAQCR